MRESNFSSTSTVRRHCHWILIDRSSVQSRTQLTSGALLYSASKGVQFGRRNEHRTKRLPTVVAVGRRNTRNDTRLQTVFIRVVRFPSIIFRRLSGPVIRRRVSGPRDTAAEIDHVLP